MKNNAVHVYVFVDALGWEQVKEYHFLEELLPHRHALEMQFGYSCTAIPTILSGKRPSEHGHFTFFNYAPKDSPFRAMRYLAPFLKPASFWSRGRVRHQLSKLIRWYYGYTGYFQLYGVPVARLPQLDYCEKQDMFIQGGLAPVKNLADVWQAQGHAWHISNWHLSEAENFKRATALLAQGTLDRCFIYAAEFDALQHDAVGHPERLQPKVESYTARIRALHQTLVKAGRPFTLTVFSDHGMTPLRGTADVPTAVAQTGLVWGTDYSSCIDSTLARFWWLKPGAEEKIRAAMRVLPGRFLTDEEQQYHGIARKDHSFGDAIFLAEPGIQFAPSDMGVRPLNGMHGYDPKDKDSFASLLSTHPLSAQVQRIADVFGMMTE